MIFPISIFLLSRLVTTHAVLNSPPPFNPNPSKTAVCGGANFVPGVTLVMNLTAGDPLSIAWQVIAGDGTGPVTATVYVNSTLQGIATDLDLNAPNVGKFQKIMTVPNVPCSNSSQPCIMNVKSSSNWFSCFAFTVGNFDPAKPRPSTPPCVKAPANLQFCETIENKFVSLPESNSVLLQDDIEKNYFNSIINNQNVVLNGSNPDCGRLLNGYLCLASMPFCGSSSSLTTSTVGMNECYCERMKATCGVTESHKDLFNCTKLIRCGETSLGKRNEWSFAWLGLGLLFL